MVQKIQKKPSAETKGFIGAALTGTKLLPCRLNIKHLFFEERFWIFEFSTFHSFQINQLPEERRGLARHGHPLQLGRVFDGTDEVGVLAHQVGQSQRHHHRRESTADEPLTGFFTCTTYVKCFLKCSVENIMSILMMCICILLQYFVSLPALGCYLPVKKWLANGLQGIERKTKHNIPDIKLCKMN